MKKIISVCMCIISIFSILCVNVYASSMTLETEQYEQNRTRYYAPKTFSDYMIIKTTNGKYKLAFTEKETTTYLKYGTAIYASKKGKEVNFLTKTFDTEKQAKDFLFLNSNTKEYEYEESINIESGVIDTEFYITSNKRIGNAGSTGTIEPNQYSYYEKWYVSKYNKKPPAQLDNIIAIGSKKIIDLTMSEILGVLTVVISTMITLLAIRKGIDFVIKQLRGA